MPSKPARSADLVRYMYRLCAGCNRDFLVPDHGASAYTDPPPFFCVKCAAGRSVCPICLCSAGCESWCA